MDARCAGCGGPMACNPQGKCWCAELPLLPAASLVPTAGCFCPNCLQAKLLVTWFDGARRDLPWRRTQDPYRIWLSEIMLQQTRVAAAIPYYEKFVERFPTVEALAAAPEADVLAHWAGLGYYSRARNLHKAARQIAAGGKGFPQTYEEIRALPGIGDYTAAAVASIAFGLPHAVVDGNVLRVLSRVACEPGDIQSTATRRVLQQRAQQLLHRQRPGDSNQAIMELGATVCLPREPKCLLCPWNGHCEAAKRRVQNQFPVKLRRQRTVEVEQTLLLIERNGSILLWQRPADATRMAGFWELPEKSQLPGAKMGREVGQFNHAITFNRFRFTIVKAGIAELPKGFQWVNRELVASIPASTILRKALDLR